jgi:hypothetical protein
MLKKALANCDFIFKSTFMLTFPGELVHGKTPEEQIDIATERFAKLRLLIFKEIKSGNLHIKTFNYFLCWEFRPETGDIHAHMLTDAYIPTRVMSKLLKRVGMGKYNYLQGINKGENLEQYRQAVKYAAKYVYKGGWNVIKGRRRYSMSKDVSDSVNKWLRENRKEFTGEIVSHEEIAIINEKRHVLLVSPSGAENIVEPGHFMYESPIKLDMARIAKMETWDPRYKKQAKKRIRRVGIPLTADLPFQDEF